MKIVRELVRRLLFVPPWYERMLHCSCGDPKRKSWGRCLARNHKVPK